MIASKAHPRRGTGEPSDAAKPTEHRTQRPARKHYAPPVLVYWGTLRDITLKVGSKGKADGGKATGRTKTR